MVYSVYRLHGWGAHWRIAVLYPPCFESHRTYLAYRFSIRETGERPSKASAYCWDCTPSYRAEMVKNSRCTRTNTTFVMVIPIDEIDEVDPEPSVQGVSPQFAKVLTAQGRLVSG